MSAPHDHAGVLKRIMVGIAVSSFGLGVAATIALQWLFR